MYRFYFRHKVKIKENQKNESKKKKNHYSYREDDRVSLARGQGAAVTVAILEQLKIEVSRQPNSPDCLAQFFPYRPRIINSFIFSS